MNRNSWIVIAAAVIIIAAIALYIGANHASAPSVPSDIASSTTTGDASGNAAVGANGESVVITYTDSGFSPANVTVAVGTTVTWTNESDAGMWIGSNDHPTHTKYDGTSTSEHCDAGHGDSDTVFDQCSAATRGGSFSFTFTKPGTWQYHNHVSARDQGTITVTSAAGVMNSAAEPQ